MSPIPRDSEGPFKDFYKSFLEQLDLLELNQLGIIMSFSFQRTVLLKGIYKLLSRTRRQILSCLFIWAAMVCSRKKIVLYEINSAFHDVVIRNTNLTWSARHQVL
jgi:hypothetical protein